MRRPTVILLVLFALLGAVVWYTQQPGNTISKALATSTIQPAQANATLINPAKGLVTRILIQNAAGKKVSIDNSSGQWMIDAGRQAPADQTLADTLAGQALTIKIVTSLEKAPDPAGTGLDKPPFIAELKQQDGTISSFKIGKLTATGSGYYVQSADGSVSIANKDSIETLINSLEKPPFPATATPAVSETPTAISTKTP